MSQYLITAIIAIGMVSAGGHAWQLARYNALDADCERRVAEAKQDHDDTRQAHQRALGQIRSAQTEALQKERERAELARQEAKAYAQQRDESSARAAALRDRLAELTNSHPAQCVVPADRVQLVREAVLGMRAGGSDGRATADVSTGDADAAVPTAAGAR